METNALAAQALQVFRALIRDTRPERALTDMQQGEKHGADADRRADPRPSGRQKGSRRRPAQRISARFPPFGHASSRRRRALPGRPMPPYRAPIHA